MSVTKDKLTNSNKKSISKLVLSNDQFSQILSMVSENRTENSPVMDGISPLPADSNLIDILISHGWIVKDESSASSELTEVAQNALRAILDPQTRVQLVLGSPKEMAVTHLYSPEKYTDGLLTIYTYRDNEGLHVIDPGHSPGEVSDALLAQLLNGPHLEGMSFELPFDFEQYLTYLAVLDLIYSRQMEAKLQASAQPVLSFSAKDVWARYAELRLGEDVLWSSVLIPFLFPNLDSKLTEKSVKSTLAKLADEKLLTATTKQNFQPSDFTLALAESLLPIISFGACTISTDGNKGMQIGFVIGLNVNLVINLAQENEASSIKLVGMDGVQLSRLLFEIGLPAKSDSKGVE